MKYARLSVQKAAQFAEEKRVLYGFTFQIDAYAIWQPAIVKKPIPGIILPTLVFAPLNKNTGEPRKTGHCLWSNRCYADTYDEAVEMYNEIVHNKLKQFDKQIISLEKQLNDCKEIRSEFINYYI